MFVVMNMGFMCSQETAVAAQETAMAWACGRAARDDLWGNG